MQQLSQTDICNLSLLAIGQRKIQSISDNSDANAIACNVAWNEAFGSVARATPWNCLRALASLGQTIAPTASVTFGTNIPSTATTWTPGTAYAVNAYVIFAGYLYQCLIANTSSASFTVDLTKGYWFQTTVFSPNFFGVPPGNTAPGAPWAYSYSLPPDFIAMVNLNGGSCWGGWGWGSSAWGGPYGGWGGGYTQGAGNSSQGQPHEIYGRLLYCNASQANIVYVQYQTDTTVYDSLFTECLYLKLAAMIATGLRKDNGEVSLRMNQMFESKLPEARTKNAGEGKPRRFNPIPSSRFIRSRRVSTNG